MGGLQLATRGKLDVRGVIWDSCPGPRPEITIPRVAALLAVNWYCARKDGLNSSDAAASSYRLLIDRGWPNLLRKLQGKQLELSVIQGVWAGHFGRDHFQLHKEVRSCSSTPTPTTTSHKSILRVKCLKNAEGRVPNFQPPGFRGQRMCNICESTLLNTRQQLLTS